LNRNWTGPRKALGVADKSSTEVASGLGHWNSSCAEGLHDTNGKISVHGVRNGLAGVRAFCDCGGVHRARCGNPVRNSWLFTFGMIACVMVAPYALVMGGLRGIPIYWRLIDCSFGIFGIIPVWFLPEMGAGDLKSPLLQLTPPLRHFHRKV